MSNINKSPPPLKNCKSYEDWQKLLDIWCMFTNLEPEKQGPAIVLTLEGEAQDAVLELSTAEITQKDGVKKIIAQLDKIYKKDELSQKYSALEAFENYKRTTNVTMRECLTEFEKKLHKIKSYKVDMTDDLLAFRLLKCANLTSRDEQLVKATITELKFDVVKTKLIKVFSDDLDAPSIETKAEVRFKSEPTFHASDFNPQTTTDSLDHPVYKDDDQFSEEHDTYYLKRKDINRYRGNNRANYNQTNSSRFGSNPSFNNSNSDWRTKTETKISIPKAKILLDRNGLPTRCAIYDSVNHWAQHCPNKNTEQRTYLSNKVVLHQSEYDDPDDLKFLMSETWSSALLDCGASKTVCGKE